MQKVQKGFTLIELIVVIVLLGILGVTALGRFQDLSGDAEHAVVSQIATEITGGSAINYAKSLTGTTFLFNVGETSAGDGATDIVTTTVAGACAATLSGFLSGLAFPDVSGLAVTLDDAAAASPCSIGAGTTYTCPVLLGGNALVPAVEATITCTE